jgi:transcriptional activator for dhaKLM operon
MQPIAYPVRHQVLTRFWHTFTETGRVGEVAGVVPDPAVVQSWQRCAIRLDPRARPRSTVLKGQALALVLKAQAELMAVAIPYIEDIHQFIEGSDCAILLADGSACILVVAGDQTAIERVTALGWEQGTYCSEGQLGTNALGMVLLNAMPIQVVGAEHYFQAYHHLTSTAAPIHDLKGRIIGLMAVVGPATTASSHTLSLVMAAARAVGNQLQTNLYLEEANRRLTEVNAILGAIHEGVIAWNDGGRITHVNERAGEMLQINPTAVQGRPLTNVLDLPPVIVEAIEEHSRLQDVEVRFEANGDTVTFLLSLRPVFEGASPPIGFIALFRPIEQVHRLVHRQIGTQATLTLEDFPAQATVMKKVLRQATIAARGKAPVLLRGEGGTGKNPLGRAIHNAGERASEPFIAINCRAIPHELMVSEFLGYEEDERHNGRPSKFELANGGTLLLDQIESLTLEMQAALLHLVETGHVMRLGSTRLIAVDTRIIAATSANLEQLVADGSFISHLYYRFGVFNINLPPLRERAEDIPLLAERFLARITHHYDRASWIDDEALAILRRYPWPGNVRELENVLERALNHSPDGTVRLVHLPDVVRNGRVMTAATPEPQPVLTVAEAEREALIRAGWACQGSVTQMAKQLGIGRTTLWRKMKRLNINAAHFKGRNGVSKQNNF